MRTQVFSMGIGLRAFAAFVATVGACLSDARGDDLLVSSRLGNKVLRYDGNGTFQNQFDQGGGLFTPNGVVLGADGMVYVSSRDGHQVLRYFTTGVFDRVFAQGPEMVGPSGLTFGPSGDLYVANALCPPADDAFGVTG